MRPADCTLNCALTITKMIVPKKHSKLKTNKKENI